MKSFNELFPKVAQYQEDRIKKAGKHKCVRVSAGSVRRLTGRGGKMLKRPVIVKRFFECKICGRDME